MDYADLLNLALPAYYAVRGRGYGAHQRLLEQSQWWPLERIQEFQWQELRQLLRYVFENVPHYQRKYAGIRFEDIRSMEDFRNLPPLSRAEVNEKSKELRDPKGKEKLIQHATGGSSGTPTRFYMNIDSFDWRMAATARAYSWSGYRAGDRALFLWGAPALPLPWLKGAKLAAYHRVRRELLFNTFKQDERLWTDVLRAATRFGPRFVIGYVSSLENFSEYVLARGIAFKGIAGVLSAAEPVTERSRMLTSAALGAPLFNAYGSREFMSIAAECGQHDGLHINAENILVETEESDPNRLSEFLITDLHNFGTPLIRYRIGDVGTLARGSCPCGRQLPRIHAVEGRVADLLHLRNGLTISGLVFPHVLKEFPKIREFQVEQRDLDSVILRTVVASPLDAEDIAGMRGSFSRILGGAISLEIREVSSIPRLPSGKRRITVPLREG